MKNAKAVSWKGAFWASPGPDTLKSGAMLVAKGLCMGSADIIPGVSGGTIALITGIYAELLAAIRSAKMATLRKLASFDVKGALSDIHIRFLLCVFLGIASAILSLARLMNYLIHHQPVYTWSLFFGLIAASIITVGRQVEEKTAASAVSFLLGTGFAWFFVGIIPISTPEEMWFIFLSGFVAICAMILPGLSGAFLLLVLGKYEFITGTLKNPFIVNNIAVIAVFCAGCVCGLLSFSRLLNYLLKRWNSIALAFLTGLMAGAMRKIWPWKKVLEEKVIRGKMHILRDQNILPGEFNAEITISVALMILGFVTVILLARYSIKKAG